MKKDKHMIWWATLSAEKAQELREKYYPGAMLVKANDIVFIYNSEHPEHKESVVDGNGLEDAALELMADELTKSDVRKYTCINLSGYSQVERNIVKGILNLQKERYSLLVKGYGDALELLKDLAKRYSQSEWIAAPCSEQVEKGQTLLDNIKNK